VKHDRLAIVMGLSPTGLYAIRELGCMGVPVLGITNDFSCGQFSKYLSQRKKFLVAYNHDHLLGILLGHAKEFPEKPVLLPTSDYYIDFLSRYSSQLKSHFVFQYSYMDGLSTQIMDKGSFHKLCVEHDISTPAVWEAETREELRDFSRQVVFPCIIKPTLIHKARKFMKGNKVLLARTISEFDNIAFSIPPEIKGWLVQEIIPGPESNIFLFAGYFDKKGQPIHTFTARKLRQYPPGFGSASLVQSESNQEVCNISIRFLQGINFKGLCGTEFKFDPRDNSFKIIEINPRPTLWFNISHSAGKRFVQTAYQDLTCQALYPQELQLDGVRWRYALKDLYSKFFYLIQGKDFIFPPPELTKHSLPVKKRSWAVFDRLDPLPTFVEPFQFTKKFFERQKI